MILITQCTTLLKWQIVTGQFINCFSNIRVYIHNVILNDQKHISNSFTVLVLPAVILISYTEQTRLSLYT